MGEMKRRMTITEALNELKLLESRIQKATYNVIFVGCAKKSSDKIGHQNKETFEKEAKAAYQSVSDLIDMRDKIKAAIVYSNAVTDVTINGVTMKVATAIETKTSIKYKEALLRELSEQFAETTNEMERNNKKVNDQIDKFIETYAGKSSDKSPDSDAIKRLSEDYHANNDYALVDPISIEQKMKTLSDEIEGFKSAVNTALVVQNSITFIEV